MVKETTRRGRKVSSEPEEEAPRDEDAEGSEEESEYEIEAVLDSKHGAFPGGKIGYLVKWKGYSDAENSWVSEDDAGNAKVLIDAYWETVRKNKKDGGKAGRRQSTAKARKSTVPEESSEPEAPKKRGRKSKEPEEDEMDVDEPPPKKKAASSSKRKSNAAAEKPATPPQAESEAEDEIEYGTMKKYASRQDWAALVRKIDTIERTEDGKLTVYFTLKNGQHMREDSDICKSKMPFVLLDFYEGNLRWRTAGDS
ncbi:hypothetical protein JAAARDRAFT_63000 [Jaapia argillacea MUCL 33604]|uniref:Chromo domain-containing protein n=1 Tax=Jaapia argillacea MUCL 33604 TaxID=933084 RepID=A0A067PA53_9AGAM|nr:hypothetical protein JAAARDRAFT_63000 [Jaapia argillacea MUCL 33604]